MVLHGFCLFSTESELFMPCYRMFRWLVVVFTSKIVYGHENISGSWADNLKNVFQKWIHLLHCWPVKPVSGETSPVTEPEISFAHLVSKPRPRITKGCLFGRWMSFYLEVCCRISLTAVELGTLWWQSWSVIGMRRTRAIDHTWLLSTWAFYLTLNGHWD